jgi:hypothetical protein
VLGRQEGGSSFKGDAGCGMLKGVGWATGATLQGSGLDTYIISIHKKA